MSEFIYSIIIPHKNCPQLLQRCLDSIPQREDTQIIVVDDNSDPQNVDFDNFPGLNRPNTEVYLEKAGKGAGYSRNVGITHANGKWLMFADSDDSFTSDISNVMDKYADDEETDMVILNAQGIDINNSPKWLRMNMYIDHYIKKRLYSEKVLRFGLWTPWSRMVKRELVVKNQILFEEIPVGNDRMFCLLCSRYANTISAESVKVYNYYLPVGRSLTNKYHNSLSTLESKIDLSFRVLKLYEEVGYLFKPFHVKALHSPIADKEQRNYYLRKYKEVLHKHKYSRVKDLGYFLLFSIGRLLKMI